MTTASNLKFMREKIRKICIKMTASESKQEFCTCTFFPNKNLLL